jgi:hypothetical protein
VSLFMVKAQLPVPVHMPDQPYNMENIDGKAESDNSVPGSKDALPPVLAAIPAGVLVIEPEPVP